MRQVYIHVGYAIFFKTFNSISKCNIHMENASEIQWRILFQIANLHPPFSYSLTSSRLHVLKQ